MSNENFFKHDDKAYAENLNDAILIANAFDYEVPVNIPSMYSNHHYPSNNNTYKAGVADITLISSGSLSIGDEAITNNTNSSQMLRLRIYPNFNNFYAWKRLNWTCTGDVTVNICDAGTSTSLLPSGALTNPDNETLLNGISNLQGLKEYDLLITIPVNGVLNTLSLVFVNNWNSQNRVSASISQGNVTGLVDDLSSLESGKADTEHTHSSSDVTESTGLPNIGTSVNASQSVVNGAVDEMVGSLSTSITNIYEASGTFITNTCFTYRTNLGNFRRVGKVVQFEMGDNVKALNTTTRGATYPYLTIPDGFKPVQSMYMQNMYWLNNEKEHQITFIAQPNGELSARVWWINSTTQDVGVMIGATWITNDTTPSQ